MATDALAEFMAGRLDDDELDAKRMRNVAAGRSQRMLSEAWAKRELLARYNAAEPQTIVWDMLGYALEVLARVYKDHPDYVEFGSHI